jgi:hypothetical protein
MRLRLQGSLVSGEVHQMANRLEQTLEQRGERNSSQTGVRS